MWVIELNAVLLRSNRFIVLATFLEGFWFAISVLQLAKIYTIIAKWLLNHQWPPHTLACQSTKRPHSTCMHYIECIYTTKYIRRGGGKWLSPNIELVIYRAIFKPHMHTQHIHSFIVEHIAVYIVEMWLYCILLFPHQYTTSTPPLPFTITNAIYLSK